MRLMRLFGVLAAASGIVFLPGCAQASCSAPTAQTESTVAAPRVPYRGRFAGRLQSIQQNARRPADVVLLGDSILARWPETMLAQAFPGARVLNAALGGDRTQNLLWRLQNTDWSGQKPREAIVLIGTNNTANSSACDISYGIAKLVGVVHQKFPTARVNVISLLPRGENMMDRDEVIRTANDLVRRGQGPGRYRFIDVHDAFYCNQKMPCDLMLGRNQVHLSDKGFDLLGRRLSQSR